MVAALRHLLLWTRPTEAGSRIFTHFTATERYPKTVEQLCVVTQLAKVKENVLGHRTVSDGIIGIVRDQAIARQSDKDRQTIEPLPPIMYSWKHCEAQRLGQKARCQST